MTTFVETPRMKHNTSRQKVGKSKGSRRTRSKFPKNLAPRGIEVPGGDSSRPEGQTLNPTAQKHCVTPVHLNTLRTLSSFRPQETRNRISPGTRENSHVPSFLRAQFAKLFSSTGDVHSHWLTFDAEGTRDNDAEAFESLQPQTKSRLRITNHC